MTTLIIALINRSWFPTSRHVALKFLTTGEKGDREVDVLRWVKEHRLNHPGGQYTLDMLDHFQVGDSPAYHVIVTDLLIPLHLIDMQMEERLISPNKVCQQLLEGLAFLHSQGITHGGRCSRTCLLYTGLIRTNRPSCLRSCSSGIRRSYQCARSHLRGTLHTRNYASCPWFLDPLWISTPRSDQISKPAQILSHRQPVQGVY